MSNQTSYKYILCLLLCVFTQMAQGQLTQRTSLGISGSNSTVTVGDRAYFVSSSLGQRSIIGTTVSDGVTLRQGYQQPPIQVVPITQGETPLLARVFPNPVVDMVHINFGSEVKGDILVLLYDIQGREIRNNIIPPIQTFQVNMASLAAGTYLLKVRVGPNEFSSQLIKN